MAGTVVRRLGALAVAVVVLALLVAPTLVRAATATSGYIEVCKASDGSLVTGTFQFTVGAQTVAVPVGACSAPLSVPAGTVTVTEEAVAGVGVVDIAISPADRLVSSSVPARSAQVTVVAGDVSTQTLVTFTNRAETGLLTVCKVAGPGIAAGTNFTFVVGGRAVAVPAGQCSIAGSFPQGSTVSVVEAQDATTRVSAIAVVPPSRVVAGPDTADASVSVAIGPGVTEVTFTNAAVPQAFLQICKRSDTTGLTGSFTFTVAGQRVDVAVGTCSPVLRVPEGVVTISEPAGARGDTLVTGVTALPAGRLVSTDLTGRSAQVRTVAGDLTQITTVTFTNERLTGQVKVCKVAGPGVALGAPFSFTVAGRSLTVPAGSCAVAGSFPLNTVVPVAEQVPAGMQVTGIRVDPPDRLSGAPSLATASVGVVVGPGVTEVSFTNQSTAPSTTTSPAVTTTVPPMSPTTTVPLASTSTTTSTAPATTTTTRLPLATTTTLAPQATTSSTVGPTTTTAVTVLPTTSTTLGVPQATTSTTGVPLAATTTVAPQATTSTTVGTPSTSTTVAQATTTSTTIAALGTTTTTAPGQATTSTTMPTQATTSTTAAPATTSTTTAGALLQSSSTATTVAPCISVPTTTPVPTTSTPTTPTTATTATTATTSPPTTSPPTTSPTGTTPTTAPTTTMIVPCVPVTPLPSRIASPPFQQAAVPVTGLRLATTGWRMSPALLISAAILLAGAALLRLSVPGGRGVGATHRGHPRRHPTFGRRRLITLSRSSQRRGGWLSPRPAWVLRH